MAEVAGSNPARALMKERQYNRASRDDARSHQCGLRHVYERISPLVNSTTRVCAACREIVRSDRNAVRYIAGRGNVCSRCEKEAKACQSS